MLFQKITVILESKQQRNANVYQDLQAEKKIYTLEERRVMWDYWQ